MNTLELKTILKNDPWAWNTKVCAIDELPSNVITYPAAFIVNTDERDEPGEHWLAIYLTCPQKAEFFDSYGHAPCYFNNKLCQFLSSYDIQYINFSSSHWGVMSMCRESFFACQAEGASSI